MSDYETGQSKKKGVMEERVWKENLSICRCSDYIFCDQILLSVYTGRMGRPCGRVFLAFYTQEIFLPYWFLYEYLGAGFVLNLHFQSSVFYFILGYLMENCQILRQSGKYGLRLGIGQAVFVLQPEAWAAYQRFF